MTEVGFYKGDFRIWFMLQDRRAVGWEVHEVTHKNPWCAQYGSIAELQAYGSAERRRLPEQNRGVGAGEI